MADDSRDVTPLLLAISPYCYPHQVDQQFAIAILGQLRRDRVMLSLGVAAVGAAFAVLLAPAAPLAFCWAAVFSRAPLRRILDERAERQFRLCVPWSAVRQCQATASVRQLDEPEARTHVSLGEQEKLERFTRELQLLFRQSPSPSAC